MFRLVKKKPKKAISLKNHFDRRNKILIKRCAGGFGDILMQRMMFEDFTKAGFDVTFSCPTAYIEMAKNHPFATAIDLSHIDETQFGAVYDITTPCRVHEIKHGGTNQSHRSDIWAKHCGLTLSRHEMYLRPLPEFVALGREQLTAINPKNLPTVLLATASTKDDFGIAKSLTNEQIIGCVHAIRERGCFPVTIHGERQEIYTKLNVTQLTHLRPQYWIALTSLMDYVISVDTAAFHMAGGLKKPLVGIFTFTNGKVYGKYYDFFLVQKHRDNGDWDCGPCFNLSCCPKEQIREQKPCLTELTVVDIMCAFDKAQEKWPLK